MVDLRKGKINERKKYDVYSKFDLEKHKKTFINYFETIINPDGTIEYAVPSHSEIVIRKYLEKKE